MNAQNPSPESRPLADPATLVESRELMRTTAKWLIGSLAATGAVLAAGTQLSSIGGIHGSRLVWALTGAGAALVAIVVALYATTRVLTPLRPHLKELYVAAKAPERAQTRLAAWHQRRERKVQAAAVEWLEKEGDFLWPVATDLEDFYLKYHEALGKGQAGDKEARERAWELRRRGAETMEAAQFFLVRRRFLQAIRVVIVSALVVGAGLITYSWAVNPGEQSESASALEIPFRTSLVLTAQGAEALAPTLGVDCVAKPVDVVVLGESPGVLDVLTVPSSECVAARVRVTPIMGTIVTDEFAAG